MTTLLNLSIGTSLYKFNLHNNSLIMVSVADFKQLDWPCLLFEGCKIKYKGGTRNKARESLKELFSVWKPQGIFQEIKDALTAFRTLASTVTSVSNFFSNINFDTLCMHVGELLATLVSVIHNKNWSSAIAFVYKVYNFYVYIIGSRDDEQRRFMPQGFEEMSTAFLCTLLPKKIQAIVKEMQLFSSSKIIDDPLVLQKLFSLIADMFEFIDENVGCHLPLAIKSWCDSLRTATNKFIILRDIKTLLIKNQKDPKIVIDELFVREVLRVYGVVTANASFMEYTKRSNYAKTMMDKFEILYKSVNSHKDTYRSEPNAFIFEGIPGCGKSTLMTKLLAIFDEPSYSHIVKPTDDAKDYYDTYQGEKIFYMDDVGQMAASQWRTLIYLVSCAKLPLTCADAKLKNTKYFTSDIILCTTNSFMELGGLTKNDGIADIHALKRRGMVFDMNEMKFSGGVYVGTIYIKYYSMQTKHFNEGFNDPFVKYLKRINKEIPTKLVNPTEDEILLWCYTIIKKHDEMKSEFKNMNEISRDRISHIKELYESQGFFDIVCEVDPADLNFEPMLDEDEEKIVKDLKEKYKVDRTWYHMVKDQFETSVESFKSIVGKIVNGTMSLSENFWETLLISVLSALPMALIPVLLEHTVFKKNKITYKKQNLELIDNIKQKLNHNIGAHSFSLSIANQVFYIELHSADDTIFKTLGCLSGHLIILPSHNILGGLHGYVSVYHHDGKGCIIDNMRYEVVYNNTNEDVAILSLPKNIPSYFKNLSKGFSSLPVESHTMSLNALGQSTSIKRTTKRLGDSPIVYNNIKYDKKYEIEQFMPYDLQEQGLCGAILTNENGQFLGMHVAGNEKEDIGISVLWSNATVEAIKNILIEDKNFLSELVVKAPIGTSGFKLDKKMFVNTSTKSDIVPSPLYDVFPIERLPAVLDVDGRHTIKTFAKKSFDKSHNVDLEAFNFAKNSMNIYLSPFANLSEKEVVKGNELLAGLNKDSSNGYGCSKDKQYYVDFENGEYTPVFRDELNKLKEEIKAGMYIDEHWFWTEAIKDELRNEGKHLKPRTFRVARIHNQVLMKEIFGNMVSSIIKDRNFNQIMVGVNPYVEWEKMYQTLQVCEGIWAGDIGSYDGKMLPQVQEAIHDLLLSHYVGPDSEMCSFLLRDMYNTSVVVNDDVWRTTHSMPSGSYLTAIVNSLVNRFYTLMWYFRNSEKPTITHFVNNVIDYVYGDDKLNGIIKKDKKNQLNAITMEKFFNNIGMTFTTASKGKIELPYESLSDVSFLKRTFRYHPLLKKVMCPLDIKTLTSGISWINCKKDTFVVMQDKIATFQREIFLHTEEIGDLLSILEDRCIKEKIEFKKLPLNYLLYIYNNESDSLKGLSWGGSRYM